MIKLYTVGQVLKIKMSILMIVVLSVFLHSSKYSPASATTPNFSNWHMTFNDEFSDPKSSYMKWNFTYPYGRRTTPTNKELQWYVDDAFEMSNGTLKIVASKQDMGSYHYTSGILASWEKFSQKYGYFEMRAKLPKGQGLWPAFWLLPASKKWPPEIDIMEMLGNRPSNVYMSSYNVINNQLVKKGGVYTGPDFSEGFHTYSLLWLSNLMIWYVDGVERFRNTDNVPSEPMYVITNLAIGGNWAGEPDLTTIFPANLEIDYIRVYQDSTLMPTR